MDEITQLPDQSADAEYTKQIIEIFKPFSLSGYTFAPLTSKRLGWIFRYFWLIPLAFLLLLLTANLGAYLMVDDPILFYEMSAERQSLRGKFWSIHQGERLLYEYYVVENGIYYFDCIPPTHPKKPGKNYLFENGDHIVPSSDYELGCIPKNTVYLAGLFSDTWIFAGPFLLILLVAAGLYSRFIKRAPKFFYFLAKSGRLKPGSGRFLSDEEDNTAGDTVVEQANSAWSIRPRRWDTYVIDFERALQSRWRWVCTGSLSLVVIGVALIYIVQRNSFWHIRTGLWPKFVSEIGNLFVFPIVISVIGGLALWSMLVVGFYIAWLRPTFKLDIQPTHADGCGGLKHIGDILLRMAMVVLIPAGLLSLWALRIMPKDSLPAVMIMVYVALLLILVIAAITFIGPVFKIHGEMSSFKDKLENETSVRRAEVEDRLRALIATNEDQQAEGQSLHRRLDLLDKLYPANLNLRTWPFGQASVITFLFGQVISIASLIVGLYEIFEAFRKLGEK
ncbi:hypothetical protein ACFLZW_05570 [Chloroflexota bacterium]